MEKTTTSQRLRQIMNERNLKQVDILNLCKPYCEEYGIRLGKNDLSQYISGKFLPKQNKLYILGLALNVSEAWLMGYDVPMERPPRTVDEMADTPADDPLADEEVAFWGETKDLTEEEKKRVLDFIRFTKSQRGNS